MSGSGSARRLAVLDTSFWTAAYRAEVIANCFDFYRIVVPEAVEREILAGQRDAPKREYPYATLFRQLRNQMEQAPPDSPSPIARFGEGEAAAISLAGHLHARLLINERRARDHAIGQGIMTVTVPAVIVALCSQGVISHRAANRKLDLIAPITASTIVAEARQTLDWIADRPSS